VTEIVDVSSGAAAAGGGRPPDPALVARLASALRSGAVVVLPTDTVYGVAALPAVPGATDRLFALKGRGADVPIAVLCAGADQALALADPAHLSDDVRRIADRLWPGPLTLVLPRRPGPDLALGEPATTVGVRCPDHALVRALAAEVGPLATSSANRHGEPTPATAAEAAAALGPGVALVVDGGPCAGAPSTVVDATGEGWRVLREGTVRLADVEAAAAP
jgi:tRNA threonylcarbamoyl adenosine modification protein (Sua5/YciO/YrdC/YwlC family)